MFGYGDLDEGARAMLEVAEVRPGDRVLDLGCGPGANGVLAMDRAGPDGHVTFLDSNVRATALAELNARENGLANFRCVTTATMDGLEPGSFDVILANPPYYANSWIAQMFIEKGKTLLKPGGRLFLVTKMVNHVAPAWPKCSPTRPGRSAAATTSSAETPGMTADEVIDRLKLQPHPVEGGFFRETYRWAGTLQRGPAARSISTAIYYLLTPKTVRPCTGCRATRCSTSTPATRCGCCNSGRTARREPWCSGRI